MRNKTYWLFALWIFLGWIVTLIVAISLGLMMEFESSGSCTAFAGHDTYTIAAFSLPVPTLLEAIKNENSLSTPLGLVQFPVYFSFLYSMWIKLRERRDLFFTYLLFFIAIHFILGLVAYNLIDLLPKYSEAGG